MYFEITTGPTAIDWTRVKHALHAADPFAGLHFEPQHARVRVEGALERTQVEDALRAAGFEATYLPHERGGSTCCGGCG